MSETGNHLRASVRQFDPSSCLFEFIDCKLVRNVLCQKIILSFLFSQSLSQRTECVYR